jgi:SSS family solute:Na+ symporter
VDYFLAGRNAGWVVIGASIFTSNIGSEHIVGLAGQGASTGMAMAHWELHAWCLIVLAGLFVPFYYKSGVQTIPEFLERRFSARARWILSCVSLVAYVFTKVSVTVYAGAIVFQALLPDTFGSPQNAFWVGAFSTVIITGIYTVFGGMRAIMSTATPQALCSLGSFVITFIGLETGGWGELGWQGQMIFALWRPLSINSLAKHHHRLAHRRPLVLVHGPIHRPARPVGQEPPPAGVIRRVAQGVAGADLLILA